MGRGLPCEILPVADRFGIGPRAAAHRDSDALPSSPPSLPFFADATNSAAEKDEGTDIATET
jgi:hypothetical protein